MKKGFSLIEVVVAMGIFAIVATLVVGAFVTVTRMKALTSAVKENQQKTRIAMEMITRLSRQAERVVVSDGGKTIDLYFNTEAPEEDDMRARFRIGEQGQLFYSECGGNPGCTLEREDNIYSGVTLKEGSLFTKIGTIPPKLEVNLHGKIDHPSPYYSDEINLETLVILERIR